MGDEAQRVEASMTNRALSEASKQEEEMALVYLLLSNVG